MKLSKITLTGADDKTSLEDLQQLQTTYPFVEWGFLFSFKQMGRQRYPSEEFLMNLFELQQSENALNAAIHLCGAAAFDTIKMNLRLIDDFLPLFNRIQINTNNQRSKFQTSDFIRFLDYMKSQRIIQSVDTKIIFQYSKSNQREINELLGLYDFVEFLFDGSGGRGVAPNQWQVIPSDLSAFGYAGGISPENITQVIENILEINKSIEGNTWLDMEGNIRNENDFCLIKCQDVLSKAALFI